MAKSSQLNFVMCEAAPTDGGTVERYDLHYKLFLNDLVSPKMWRVTRMVGRRLNMALGQIPRPGPTKKVKRRSPSIIPIIHRLWPQIPDLNLITVPTFPEFL